MRLIHKLNGANNCVRYRVRASSRPTPFHVGLPLVGRASKCITQRYKKITTYLSKKWRPHETLKATRYEIFPYGFSRPPSSSLRRPDVCALVHGSKYLCVEGAGGDRLQPVPVWIPPRMERLALVYTRRPGRATDQQTDGGSGGGIPKTPFFLKVRILCCCFQGF